MEEIQMSRNEALERIEFRVRHTCPEAGGSNIGDCYKCWRYPCNDMKALLVLRDLTEEERPHGEWEKYGDKTEAYDISGIKTWGQKRKCTNCDFIKTYIEDFGLYSICPNCGADMRKEGDEK